MDWQGAHDVIQAIHEAELIADDPLQLELSAKGVEAFPESADLWAIRARYLWAQMLDDESEGALEKAFDLDADRAVAWAVRASISAGSGDMDEALEAAGRAVELDGEDPTVIEYCLDAYYATGDSATALSLASTWCAVAADDPLALAHHISGLLAAGRRHEAVEALEEAERRFPDCVPLMRRRALYMMRQELPASIRLFRVCAERSPRCSMTWAQLSIALVAARLYGEAEEAAKRALEISPRAVNAMQSMAKIAMRRGDRQEAEEWQRKAMAAIPGIAFASALAPAGNAARLGQWKRALRLAEPILSAPSPSIRHAAGGIKARALVELARLKEAERTLDELEEDGWEDPARYELRGRILLARLDRDGAIAQFRAGLDKYPTDGLIRAQLVVALSADAARPEREALVSDIVENPPDTPWGLLAVARALLTMGYKQEALRLRWICQQRFPYATEYHMLSLGDWLRHLAGLTRLLLHLLWLRFRLRGQAPPDPPTSPEQ